MDDWKDGYRKALTEYVLKHGQWADTRVLSTKWEDQRDLIYGWTAHDSAKLIEHIKKCGVDYELTDPPVEDNWSEFQDTFSPNLDVYGITMDVACNCGHILGRTMRVNERLSAVIIGVLGESNVH